MFGQFREIESCINELESLVRQAVCPQFRNWSVHQDGDEFINCRAELDSSFAGIATSGQQKQRG